MMARVVSYLFVSATVLACLGLRADAQVLGMSLNGQPVANNSIVVLQNIGEGDAGALLCTTNRTACCTRALGLAGEWFYPDGRMVPINDPAPPATAEPYYRSRGTSLIRLNRRSNQGLSEMYSGVYCCEIPDQMNVMQTLCVGAYLTESAGSPSVTGLNNNSLSRTLTCTSTGGPATNVTWRRDWAVITLNATYQQTKRVVNAATGTYQTVLTISESVSQSDIAGLYSCTVENVRGSSSRILVIPGNGVRFILNGITYQNNSIMTLEDIGEGDNALTCVTDQSACCRPPYSISATGNWFLPNGTRVPSSGEGWDFHRTRGQSTVRLQRRRGGEDGIYSCVIPDAMNVIQTIYIGMYSRTDTGQVTVDEITFQLEDADTPVFTLTCTSTGGPVSTVSWRRDGTLLSDDSTYNITSEVTDGTTSTYNHTLTVTGRLVGQYQCNVSNIRTPSGSTRTLTVGVANPPTGLSAAQVTLTGIRVSWTAPDSGATVTGYRLSYSGGTEQGSMDVGASATEHTITITQPRSPLTYSISIITLSSSFPSSMAGPIMVTVELLPATPNATSGAITSTSTMISWNQQQDADSYEISFQRATGNQQLGDCPVYQHSGSVPSVGATVTTSTLTGLQEFSTYFITVTAVNAAGRSGNATVTVTTATAAPSGGPQMVRAMAINSTHITITWEAVNCAERNSNISGYVVRYTPPSSGGIDSVTVVGTGDAGGRVTIGGLNPSTQYSIRVAAVNSEGALGVFSAISVTTENPPGGGSGGAIAGGIIGALIVVALIVVIVILVIWLWRRYYPRDKYATTTTTTAAPPKPQPMRFTKLAQNGEGEKTVEPVIEEFPHDIHVTEGETVALTVRVSGQPKPTLHWYHEGNKVVADYATEIEEDGSLTIPSAEPRHTGVYQLVAENSAGSMEKEVKVFVHVDGEATPDVQKRFMVLQAVPIANFGRFVADNHSNNNRRFRDQYATIEAGEEFPATIATTPKTRPLNRFANITVYDHNRIALAPIPGHDDCQRDYINACYIDGYSIPKKFIATQGPLPKTVTDFWRLVWQERPMSIVMVTNVKEGNKIKCQHYWPDSGSKNYGPFQVTITDQQTFADYTIRTFQMALPGSSGHRPLSITQYHFTAWPDHGVPDYATPILAFHRRVKSKHNPRRGPLLVHCSAGVGRTGTFITIDNVLEQVSKEGMVDISGTIIKIRQQRMKMVQTVEQYVFVHDAILESLTCGDTQITPADVRTQITKLEQRDSKTRMTGFESQFKVLHQVSPKPDEVRRETALQYPHRNRSMDYLPADRWRVLLKGEHPDYIHAVSVNGYKQQKAFIITQGPMDTTTKDFWKMVYDRKCGAIVMLSKLSENVCYQYWPTSGVQKIGGYTIDLIGEENLEGFVIRTLSVVEGKSGKAHQVSQFHIVNWNADGRCSNLKTITDVIEEVTKVQMRTGNNPIVVHCSDTVSRSGMFCAIATTIERCKTEGVVDIFQVVKALRVQKPGAILNVEQYKVVFQAVLTFLDSFDTYANFQNI